MRNVTSKAVLASTKAKNAALTKASVLLLSSLMMREFILN